VDNKDVDRERAETHLRLIAEAELRSPRPDARFTQVAHALMAVGAIDSATAEAIQHDYDIASTVRLSQSDPRQARPLRSLRVRRQAAWMIHSARQAQWPTLGPTPGPFGGPAQRPAQPPAADRVAPIGMMIPIRHDDVRGELYVMSYAHTQSGARFTITAWLRGSAFGRPPHPPAFARALQKIAATDDNGTSYRLTYNGTGGLVELAGELFLNPTPPPDLPWLDVTVGETTTRIRIHLDQQAAPPVRLTPAAHSPGEHYLDGIAARILASLPVSPRDGRRHGPQSRPVLAEHLTHGLGDVIDALQAAGVLSPLSPVAGQLRTLCESTGVTDHGITAPARADLPDPWLSLLAHFHRRRPGAVSPGEGCAGVAVALPELDGVRLCILGLHNGEDGTVIHVLAIGIPPTDGAFPLLWLRDEDGRWHTTRRNISGFGEVSARLEVVPPLNRGSWIEVVAAGRSAEATVSLPLRWR
jgi:hypothetical protein